MDLLAFAASHNEESHNRRLLEMAAAQARSAGAKVTLVPYREFDMPLYEDGLPLPPGAEAFKRRLDACDAVMIASPEFNLSLPGHLKNAIDWISRYRPHCPIKGKTVLLLSASPSAAGGNRGLWALRIPLEALGAMVYPDMYSLALSHQAFTPEGGLKDPVLAQRLTLTVYGFVDAATALGVYWRPLEMRREPRRKAA